MCVCVCCTATYGEDVLYVKKKGLFLNSEQVKSNQAVLKCLRQLLSFLFVHLSLSKINFSKNQAQISLFCGTINLTK